MSMRASLRFLIAASAIGAVLSACGPRPVTTVDESGVTRREGEMLGRKQIGTWTYYDATGAREARGTWQDDKQFGAWTWWHPDGSVKQQGSYAPMGLRTGWWTFHQPGGNRQAAGGYGDGIDGALDRQHGPWTWWRADGSVAASGVFVDSSRALVWTTRAADGAPLTQGAYHLGRRVGPWREDGPWVDRGAPEGFGVYREPRAGTPRRWGMLQDQRPVGVWVAYRSDGTVLAAAERADRLQRLLLYRPDGSPEAWVFWGADGTRQLTLYADGQPVADQAALPPDAESAPLEERLAAAIATLTAPLTETAAEATLAEDLPAPMPATMTNLSLSPQPVLPGLWTASEEGAVTALVRAYTRGRTQETGGYGFSEPPGGDRRLASQIEGKALPMVRVLAANGSVLSLASAEGPTAVVVMRGFSGQVCVYCASQTAALADQIERFRERSCRVVLLYPGSVESVPIFLQAVQSLGREVPADLVVAMDPDLAFVKALGIEHMLARPTTLVVDRAGGVHWAYVGRGKDDRPGVDEIVNRIEAAP